MKCAWNVR